VGAGSDSASADPVMVIVITDKVLARGGPVVAIIVSLHADIRKSNSKAGNTK
jgi:hypothetical protein